MTNIYPLPSNEQRYDEASLWIERLGEGLSAEEEEELKAWMVSDPANRALFFNMVRLWDKMDVLSRLSTLFPEPVMDTRAPRFRLQGWLRAALPVTVMMFVAIAAGWAVLFLEPFGTVGKPPAVTAAAFESVYKTAIGEQATVTLTDGTELTLNTRSRVRIEYTPAYRLLVLEVGEMLVQVAPDPARPLSVIASDNVVQAIGTAFNVEITQDNRVELLVMEGKVRVGVRPRTEKSAEPVVPIVLPDSSVTVAAGEETILSEPEETIKPISDADIHVKLSWRQGNLIFRGDPLDKTVAEVERYTADEFVILDEELKKVRVSGFFKAGDVDGMLAVLRENFDIAYERVGENRVLLSAL